MEQTFKIIAFIFYYCRSRLATNIVHVSLFYVYNVWITWISCQKIWLEDGKGQGLLIKPSLRYRRLIAHRIQTTKSIPLGAHLDGELKMSSIQPCLCSLVKAKTFSLGYEKKKSEKPLTGVTSKLRNAFFFSGKDTIEIHVCICHTTLESMQS